MQLTLMHRVKDGYVPYHSVRIESSKFASRDNPKKLNCSLRF